MIFITKAWHSRGQRFDPAYLHQKTLDFVRNRVFFLLFGLFCVRYFGLGQQMDNKRFTVSSFLTAERKNKWHLSKKNEQKTNIFGFWFCLLTPSAIGFRTFSDDCS